MSGSSHRDGECCPVQQLVALLPEQIDASNAGPVRERLLALIGHGVTVLVADMTATVSCDHAGAEALAWVYQQALATGTELQLVISVPAVRRVIAISGLDRFAPVFPTLEAAQAASHLASVVRLPPRAASPGSAALAALPGVSRPVSWLPVGNPARAVQLEHSARQAVHRNRLGEALTQITGGIFHAALTLQSAVGLPAPALGQAVEHVLHLLDSTISETRSAAFVLAGPGAGNPADVSDRGAVVPPGMQAGAGAPMTIGENARRRAMRLVYEARETRGQSAQNRARSKDAHARSVKARAQARQIAVLAAVTRYRVATTCSQVAAS